MTVFQPNFGSTFLNLNKFLDDSFEKSNLFKNPTTTKTNGVCERKKSLSQSKFKEKLKKKKKKQKKKRKRKKKKKKKKNKETSWGIIKILKTDPVWSESDGKKEEITRDSWKTTNPIPEKVKESSHEEVKDLIPSELYDHILMVREMYKYIKKQSKDFSTKKDNEKEKEKEKENEKEKEKEKEKENEKEKEKEKENEKENEKRKGKQKEIVMPKNTKLDNFKRIETKISSHINTENNQAFVQTYCSNCGKNDHNINQCPEPNFFDLLNSYNNAKSTCWNNILQFTNPRKRNHHRKIPQNSHQITNDGITIRKATFL
ncbi:hypothetical protein M0813_24305 [Anaeramoeba flamelloides]|uniref:CCHC-type domain-containing protein n=1 Tax=Anaeramoeba flamelloides TaxID=1746091 RepID=A0ABQ8Y669_9EUKA|nr:hypothetical protein M0813_24305 [Anaeramoeba flamelloides]